MEKGGEKSLDTKLSHKTSSTEAQEENKRNETKKSKDSKQKDITIKSSDKSFNSQTKNMDGPSKSDSFNKSVESPKKSEKVVQPISDQEDVGFGDYKIEISPDNKEISVLKKTENISTEVKEENRTKTEQKVTGQGGNHIHNCLQNLAIFSCFNTFHSFGSCLSLTGTKFSREKDTIKPVFFKGKFQVSVFLTTKRIILQGSQENCTISSYYCNPTAEDLVTTIKDKSITSVEDCAIACDKDKDCVYYTFLDFRGTQSCYILKGCTEKVKNYLINEN